MKGRCTSNNDSTTIWQKSVPTAEWVLSDVVGLESVACHIVHRSNLCVVSIIHLQGPSGSMRHIGNLGEPTRHLRSLGGTG